MAKVMGRNFERSPRGQTRAGLSSQHGRARGVAHACAARVRFERAMRDLRRLVRHAGELSRVRAYVL